VYYGASTPPLSSPTCTSVTGSTIGNLTYTYDADGRLIDQGGAMARSNVTSSFTASYTPTNQVQTWNTGSGPVSAQSDDNSDLTTDPSNGFNYSWDARNQLTQVSNASETPIQAMSYDAVGRRQTMGAPYQYFNEQATYLHDGTTEIASSGYLQGTQMMTGLDGEVLSYTDNGPIWQGASWVPLHDGQGSTIATVNSSGTVDTQYTYDPFGQTTRSGQQFASLPYLYKGMDQDGISGLYYGGSQYYNPQLTRPVSQVGPTGNSGGIPGMGSNSPTGEGGGLSWEAQSGAEAGANLASGAIAGSITASLAAETPTLGFNPVVGGVVMALTVLAFEIDNLVSGPPSIPYKDTHSGHDENPSMQIVGQQDPVNQSSALTNAWIYEQSTGNVYHADSSGNLQLVGSGYSGLGTGVNNPGWQTVPFQGPIPQGHWHIGPSHTTLRQGPMTMNLDACPETDTFGRDDFRIHGDNRSHNHSASEGCVILPPDVREQIQDSGDTDLWVIP